MKPKSKVAAYARISAESDRLLNSLSAQISYYSELIQKNPEWEYVGVYADSGISGVSTKRTEFQRLITDCKAGKIDIVLTKSISRFARNTVDLLNTVRLLKELNVEIRFEKENLSTFSADGEFMLTILAAFAEEESKSISSNIKWAVKKKFEKGKVWHTEAFGYRWNGETFIVNEQEAETVRKIYNDYLNDVPIRQIARWLKSNGYRCSSVYFVEYVLQNEVYTGNKMLQKYYTPKVRHMMKNEGQLPKYYVENNHEPIISKELFEKVQNKIKANYEFNPSAHRIVKPSCFFAKIKCCYCGGNYIKGLTKSNKTDGLKEHWYCFEKVKKRCPKAKKYKWYKTA